MTFSQGHWIHLGPWSDEKWYGNSSHAQKGQWDCAADKMVQRFRETGHLVFKSISALSRGILKQKKGITSIHFNGDSMNTELLFGTIHSVNQLTVNVHRIHTRSVHHEHNSHLTSTDHICTCGSGHKNCSVIFVRMNRVCHLVSHVISLLVSASPSLFQSTTTRSTTWTARPSPRRHCTPSTSSTTYPVDKQRY